MKSAARRGFGLLVALLGAGLAAAIVNIPDVAGPLPELVAERMSVSGVEHPVTAVLLNFRGYDTLLELLVLLLALLGAWGLTSHVEGMPLPPASEVLRDFVAVLVPVLVVVAVYLWWIGSYSPGGAFQAGALLAAAGVMLSFVNPTWRSGRLEIVMELLILPGVAVFAGVGLLGMALGGHFLEYPVDAAGALIVLVEGFAALSIGVILQTLFVGTARIGDTS